MHGQNHIKKDFDN